MADETNLLTATARYHLGEVIHEGRRLRIQRARRAADGLPVILKSLKPNAASDEGLARFQREYRLLARLTVPGVIKAHELLPVAGAPIMVLEEIGGTSLDRLPALLPLVPLLQLAIGLAETLAALHDQGVIHKNINPANILYHAATGEFRLIDFAIADELPQRAVVPQPPAALEGTLAFISPEQTGRMNRAVDYRTDFYSLGVTFYQLLTGMLPFEAADDLGLVHCHLAATPPPPHLRNSRVPEVLSRIVLKLMAKMAEDRYQDARGLKADLDRCLHALQAGEALPTFTPGSEDFTDRLQMPQRLYGRDPETARLLAAFTRAAAGHCEMLLVAGYSGVGKSALVHELHRPVLARRGYFIEGKFDQLRRHVPYSAFAQSFEGFVQQVLMEDEARLGELRHRILDAVRNSGGVLTDVLPALTHLLGPQPEVATVVAGDAQNRFVFLFIDLMKAIASPEQPLVLFLDDLQWVDAASLHLLYQLARAATVRGVLVVGAYRDNEVDPLHPLATTIEALRKEGTEPERLTLANLSEATTNELIADMLHGAPAETLPLTRVVYAKTGGNAFFTLHMLKSLAENRAIAFDRATRRWRWDLPALEQMEISDNVVALMVTKIRTLTESVQRTLSLAACVGFRFPLATITALADRSEAETLDTLQPALREGLLIPANQHHFQFVHDRVRQAAYALIPEGDKEQVHFTVGKTLLLRLTAEPANDEQIFTVADNLDAGLALLTDRDERLAAAELNLRAGIKAKDAAAFSVAAHYFRQGFRLLPADGWERHYPLTLALHKENAQCEYLASNHEVADALIAAALDHAASAYDKAEIYASQVIVYTTQNRFADSMAAGLTALRLFDLDLPDHTDEHGLRVAADRALERYRDHLRGTDLARVADAPAMSDRNAIVCMELLVHMVLAAYYLNRTLYTLLTVTMTNLALRYGNSSAASLGYVLMAAISITELNDFKSAKALGRLALDVNARHPNPALEGKILMFYTNTVAPWFQPLGAVAPEHRRGFVTALDAGALNDAANCLWGLLRNALVSGGPLSDAMKECHNVLAFTERIHDPGFHLAMVFLRQVIRSLQGRLANPSALSADDFDEAAFLDVMIKSGFYSTLAHYNILKGWTLFTLGRFDEARRFVEASRSNIRYVADQPHTALHHFHHSLLLLREPLTSETSALVADNQKQLALFAEFCPGNYRHLHLLVEAERKRIDGRPVEAAALYDQAIESAAHNGNWYVEGSACEAAARFALAQRREDSAATYVQRAHLAFRRWQAEAKTKALEQEFPRWLLPKQETAPAGGLDLDTVMKASRAISGEIELPRLVDTLVRIGIENAGAQRGVLLLEDAGAWQVMARGEIGDAQTVLPHPVDMTQTEWVATGVVRYVARTRERIVLDDAANQESFAADPYIRQRQTKSLLCAPLVNRGRVLGVFYLENDLTTAAFTPARVQLLETLLAQAAISIENARVYEALRESEAKYRRIVDTATEGIAVLDAEGSLRVVNARLAQMLGYTAEEIIGKSFSALMFDADLDDHRQRMVLRRQGLSETYERRFRRKDGAAVWTLASATPIMEEGRFSGSFGMFTDITERRRAESELLRSNRFLRTLSRCNETLVHATDESKLLHDMCHVVVDSGSFALAWVGYLDATRSLSVVASVEAHNSDYLREGTHVSDGDPAQACCPCLRAALSGEMQLVPEVTRDTCVPWRERTAGYGYGSSIALPLRASGQVIGVLAIFATESGQFGPDEVSLLSELASDLGFGIEGLRVRRDREQFMERLSASMRSTIQALSNTVELRDPYTAGHQRRVAELASAVSRSMGWSEERVQALFLAGMVHDIGKIAVPSEILSKPGRLSLAEMQLVRTHVDSSYDILKSVDFPWPIADIVRQHHERLDGSGYPRKLQGDEIAMEARVLAVCDVVEAMTTHRPYRPGLGVDAALATITEGRGTLFDASVVDHCIKIIRHDGFRFEEPAHPSG